MEETPVTEEVTNEEGVSEVIDTLEEATGIDIDQDGDVAGDPCTNCDCEA
jgi:uncharacterized protein YuzE